MRGRKPRKYGFLPKHGAVPTGGASVWNVHVWGGLRNVPFKVGQRNNLVKITCLIIMLNMKGHN